MQGIPHHAEIHEQYIAGFVPAIRSSTPNKSPLRFQFLELAFPQLRTTGLLRNAPHPHAAMLFYDFMLSDAQQILSQQYYVPTRNKIETPFTKLPLKFIDPALPLELNEKWINEHEEIVTKRARQ